MRNSSIAVDHARRCMQGDGLRFHDYELALSTLGTAQHVPGMTAEDRHLALLYLATALAGEVGEACEKIKKHVRDGKDLREAVPELGDVLWYLVHLAHECGASLQAVAALNVEKLAQRVERDTVKGDGDTR